MWSCLQRGAQSSHAGAHISAFGALRQGTGLGGQSSVNPSAAGMLTGGTAAAETDLGSAKNPVYIMQVRASKAFHLTLERVRAINHDQLLFMMPALPVLHALCGCKQMLSQSLMTPSLRALVLLRE